MRLAAAAGSMLLMGGLAAAPAGADRAEVFLGSASGSALDLSVAGQTVSLGRSATKATSQLTAIADAAGQIVAVGDNVAPTHAEASANGKSQTQPRTCAPVSLPTQISAILDVGLACSQGTASVTDNLPVATAVGSVGAIGLSANTVLSTLPVQNLATTLQPITGQLPQGAKTTLDALVTSVLKTKTFDVSVGEAASSVTAEANKVTSTATAAGAVIKIFPTPQINGAGVTDPVATITVGPAKATAVYDRAAAKATPVVDTTIVRVALNPAIATGLGVPAEISVPVDQDFSVPGLAGTPLESHIRIAHGTTATDADGTVRAVSDAVSIVLAQGINGGVALHLAHAEAAVNGAPAVAAAPAAAPGTPQATPVAATNLPRTGPVHPWLPAAGAAVLVIALLAWRSARRAL
jgi:hypothetical protein